MEIGDNVSISREEMISLDKNAIEYYGIRSIVLMENAAMAIFNEIKEYNSFTIVCGSGNNGGDGLALARHLVLNNKIVDVFIIKGKESDEFSENLNILKKLSKNIYYIESLKDLDRLKESLNLNRVTVDGIFGTGLKRNLEDIYFDVVSSINDFSNYTIAIDIPLGLDANTGEVLGNCVIANKTIAIEKIKVGLEKNSKFVGEIKKIYIGIPEK